MKIMENIFKWGNAHHPGWLFFLRAILGIILFYKGYFYGQNANEIKALTDNSFGGFWSQYIIHYIVMVHLAGGFFIAIGLITRLSIAFQIPILLGAVLLWGRNMELIEIFSQFGFALLVLILLILFFILGSGPISADEYFKKHTSPYPLKHERGK